MRENPNIKKTLEIYFTADTWSTLSATQILTKVHQHFEANNQFSKNMLVKQIEGTTE